MEVGIGYIDFENQLFGLVQLFAINNDVKIIVLPLSHQSFYCQVTKGWHETKRASNIIGGNGRPARFMGRTADG